MLASMLTLKKEVGFGTGRGVVCGKGTKGYGSHETRHGHTHTLQFVCGHCLGSQSWREYPVVQIKKVTTHALTQAHHQKVCLYIHVHLWLANSQSVWLAGLSHKPPVGTEGKEPCGCLQDGLASQTNSQWSIENHLQMVEATIS